MYADKMSMGSSCISKGHSLPTHKDIDFTSAKNKKKAPNKAATTQCGATAIIPDSSKFCRQLNDCGTKILSIQPEYSNNYIPKSQTCNFPKALLSMCEPKYVDLAYHELLLVCESISITVTEAMAEAVEEATRAQSHSRLWFTYRAGRITASRMKSVCRTDIALPAQSLIKAICYPEAFKFTSTATKWGCEHEATAREHYKTVLAQSHVDMMVVDSGLVINPEWPHLGASPDGLVLCACCGKGVVEIKCPYCHHDEDIETVTTNNSSCLVKSADGSLHLDQTHTYYYQVQTQIFVCRVDYCDFCVCTFPETGPSVHIERVLPDYDFWKSCVDKATQFFKKCILPEILGKWYTRPFTAHTSMDEVSDRTKPPPITSQEGACLNTQSQSQQILYCYCQNPDDGSADMIGCDNVNCSDQWFHLKCLKIKAIPKGKWYCPDICKLPEFKRNKTKKHV